MAVEPTNENKDAAAPQDPAPGAMLTDEDLESLTKKRKVCAANPFVRSCACFPLSPKHVCRIPTE